MESGQPSADPDDLAAGFVPRRAGKRRQRLRDSAGVFERPAGALPEREDPQLVPCFCCVPAARHTRPNIA